MASRYGGEYTPKKGWAAGQTFGSYYAYRNATAARAGFEPGRTDEGKVYGSAYAAQQAARKTARSRGVSPRLIAKQGKDVAAGKDPRGQATVLDYHTALKSGDKTKADAIYRGYVDQYGDPDPYEPADNPFWYH